jgi:hypothetical protein
MRSQILDFLSLRAAPRATLAHPAAIADFSTKFPVPGAARQPAVAGAGRINLLSWFSRAREARGELRATRTGRPGPAGRCRHYLHLRVDLFATISRAREAGGAIETDPRAPPTSFARYRFGANAAAAAGAGRREVRGRRARRPDRNSTDTGRAERLQGADNSFFANSNPAKAWRDKGDDARNQLKGMRQQGPSAANRFGRLRVANPNPTSNRSER